MDILKQLEEGKPFSGRNGAFTGRVEPQSIEGDTLKVICDKSVIYLNAMRVVVTMLHCLRNTYLH